MIMAHLDLVALIVEDYASAGLFLRVDNVDVAYARMIDAGVAFVTAPRTEPFGKVAVFVDIAGNRWDLLGPRLDGAPKSAGEGGAEAQTSGSARLW